MTGSLGSCDVGSVVTGAAGGVEVGAGFVAGGAVGDVCCVPGGALGLVVAGCVPGGTAGFCSWPGGLVASRGVARGDGVGV